MSEAPRGRRASLLENRGDDRVTQGLIPSAGLHALLVGAMILPGLWGITLPGCGHRPPPLLDRDIFMVEAVILPKAKRMPKKAAAPKPPEIGKSGKKAPEPVIKDQMVLKTKDREKKAGKERPPEKKPEKKPKKKSRADLLAARTTETSDKPIFETSVDGDEDVEPDMALASKFGKPMSAYERRVHDRVKDNWFPKAGQSPPAPSLWAVVSFDVDDSGNIAGPSLQRRSGDRIFDSSCLRSVARTRRVPPPPSDAPRRFHIRFSPEDKK